MNRLYRLFLFFAMLFAGLSVTGIPNFASERLLDVGIYYSRLAPDWVKLDADSPMYLELHGLPAGEILGNYAVGRDAKKFVSLPLRTGGGGDVKRVVTRIDSGYVVILEKLDLSQLEKPGMDQASKEALVSWMKEWDAKQKAFLEKGITVVPILDQSIPQVIGMGVVGFQTQSDALNYLSEKQLAGEVFQVDASVYLTDRDSDQTIAVLSPEHRFWSVTSRTEQNPRTELSDGVISMICSSTEESVRYRGGFRIARGSKGHNNLVNRVEMERYLYSVLPREMGYQWPMEALKAQAIAARNYAISPNSKFDGYGFDLDDSESSQVYGGYDSEYDSTTLAVDATKGLYATSDKVIVPLFYHATSGGYIESTEEVWGEVNKYLLGKVDIYSTDYKWELNLTSTQMADFLKKEGHSVGEVNGVEIVERMPSGRVYRLRFHGSDGSVEIKAHRLSSYIGNNVMRSSLYSFDPDTKNGIFSEDIEALIEQIGDGRSVSVAQNPTGPSPSNPEKERTKLGDLLGPTISKNPPRMTDKEVEAETAKVAKSQMSASQNAIASLIPKNHRLPAQEHALFVNGTLKIYGHGYGHGIGMSQVGAKRMALQGYTFDRILKFYYDGIEIVNDNQ